MIDQDTMQRTIGSLLLVVGLAACGDDLPEPGLGPGSVDSTSTGSPSLDSTTTTSTTTGGSTSTSTSSSSSTTTEGGNTFGEVDDCLLTNDCPAGLYCVAPFDQSLGPEGKGLNECVADCVDIMDETRWCTDEAACCDPTAECTDRGYCVHPSDSTGGDTGTGTAGSTGA